MRSIIILIVLSINLGSCTSQSTNISNGEMSESPSTIKRVNKEEFTKYLSNNKTVQLIDVRTPEEYHNGKIERAVNIDFMADNFESNIQKLDKTKPTLIYCQAGGRSAKALKKMEEFGFEFVLELEGGYSNW